VLATIDLTERQAARVLEQAVRTRTRVEIEARLREGVMCGTLAERHSHLLRVELHDQGRDWPLAGLVGAFCEVQTVLSGQLYLFSTCIVDAADNSVPQHLLLAVPEVVQVANRRRFDRKTTPEHVELQLWVAGSPQTFTGTLSSIGFGGLGCRLLRRELEELLLIDDEVRVRFRLPWVGAACELKATVCGKTRTGDGEHLDVGLEFRMSAPGEPARAGLEQLRAMLARAYADGTKPEGEA
jgi:hypothetical protein